MSELQLLIDEYKAALGDFLIEQMELNDPQIQTDFDSVSEATSTRVK